MGLTNAVKKMVGLHSGRITKSWGFDSQSSLLVGPTVADVNNDGADEVIIGTSKGEVIVLDTNAKEMWRYNVQEKVNQVEEMFLDTDVMNSINASPVVGDVTGDGKLNILFGSEMGVLYCLDENGKLIWKFKTKGGIRGSPLIADVNGDGKKEIVFGCLDKFLYILKGDGSLIEKFEQNSAIESTPGYFNGQIVFGTNDGSVISLSSNGEPKWVFPTRAKVVAAPVFTRLTSAPVDFLIIGSTDNNVYCLDVDGEPVWTYETEGAIYAKATVADLNNDGKKELLVGSCDNNIHAISHDGEKFWSYETDFWVVGSPLVADIDGDGKLEVIAGSYDHNIYILDSQGTYLLDYVPGISGVVQQSGHYSEIMTQEPGQHVGKKLWQFKTEGVVVGCTEISKGKGIVIATKTGLVDGLEHKN